MTDEKIRLGDACDILNGFAFKSENYVDSGIRVIRIANVQKGYIEDNTPAFYPLETNELDRYMLEEGDLLMSLTGNVGRVAILKKEFMPAALNQRVACLRLKTDRITKDYLFHVLNSDFFEQQCIQSSKGVAQKNMSTEWLKDYEIPMYSKEQQESIAYILDKTKNIIISQNHELQKLDDLIKARFVEMFGDPVSNPFEWDIVAFDDCLESIENGKSFVCDSVARADEKPAILKLSAATHGVYKPEENKAIINEEDFVESAEVHDGDLLFTRKNTPELVGMAAYVESTPKKLMMPDLIFRLNTKTNCNKIFMWKLINHDLYRSQIESAASGSAKSMSNISKERLGKLRFPLPPLELQEQFVDFVKQVDKSKFVERFPELSLFYGLSSPLDSEMICIFPCFCPCEESVRAKTRGILFRHCSLLYQEVLRNPALLFLLSERKCSLWY